MAEFFVKLFFNGSHLFFAKRSCKPGPNQGRIHIWLYTWSLCLRFYFRQNLRPLSPCRGCHTSCAPSRNGKDPSTRAQMAPVRANTNPLKGKSLIFLFNINPYFLLILFHYWAHDHGREKKQLLI